jgi:MYXO-CTERM domain-containing protein
MTMAGSTHWLCALAGTSVASIVLVATPLVFADVPDAADGASSADGAIDAPHEGAVNDASLASATDSGVRGDAAFPGASANPEYDQTSADGCACRFAPAPSAPLFVAASWLLLPIARRRKYR